MLSCYQRTSRPLPHRTAGFTIVELLIVVVVIAILAAITIVAYNGVTNRAKASAAASAAEQAAKKVGVYAVTNSDTLPNVLSDAGVTDSNGTTYQYRTYNSGSNYCITATTSNVSYYVDNESHSTPTAGACAGQGANGASPITNLALDPRATQFATVNGPVWKTARWFGNSPSTGTYSLITGAADGPVGISTYARKTWSSFTSGGGDFGYDNGIMSATAGTTYTFSSYLRANADLSTARIQVAWRDSTGTPIGSQGSGNSVNLTSGAWGRISATLTAPAGTASVQILSDVDGTTNIGPGLSLDGTGMMVTQGGTLYNFADGASPGWIWNGTANNSTSVGSPA
ncbi:MAG TPA: prepilin-type N-terminal cleavage/methylation domain-containing protein [Dongiaceae bacterium]|nr:prepilin-type N-terminal cleavage/methylation domain-containing protein [Dongiaceae bacterium]